MYGCNPVQDEDIHCVEDRIAIRNLINNGKVLEAIEYIDKIAPEVKLQRRSFLPMKPSYSN